MSEEPDFITRPFKKKPKPPRPSAEVVALPNGGALALAKEGRTRADEISSWERAVEHNKRVREEMRQQRINDYMSSPAYRAAGERFNEELAQERDSAWFDPTQPFGFRR